MNKTVTKNHNAATSSNSAVLRSILEEIRLLRNELALLFPSEDLEGYAHAGRVKKSYARALKQYPPVSAWK